VASDKGQVSDRVSVVVTRVDRSKTGGKDERKDEGKVTDISQAREEGIKREEEAEGAKPVS
jgi:hypothetical protein